MSSSPLGRAALAALLLLTTSCDNDSSETPDAGTVTPDAGLADSGTGMFSAGGTLRPGPGKQVPESAKLVVLWSVSSSSPDYLYKFGEGTSSGDSFTPQLPTPPAEALNRGELGVGLVLLEPTSFSQADGRYEDEDVFTDPLLGAAEQFAIIYKANEQVATPSWSTLFPVGYSCGKAVAAPPGASHDTFEPMPCVSIKVIVDDIVNLEFPNWT